ncbi:hypothetical protein ACFWP0_12395 [Achromobacter sp. NPDC058515]|uniref:hypothetical protein n=1 Tax=Achromobacter sp. NPDC058515 TaxID=3346533 RepID=UPI00365B820E
MSEFKHQISYYRAIIKDLKSAQKRAPVSPKVEDASGSAAKEITQARVRQVMRHHGEVLRALKDR